MNEIEEENALGNPENNNLVKSPNILVTLYGSFVRDVKAIQFGGQNKSISIS